MGRFRKPLLAGLLIAGVVAAGLGSFYGIGAMSASGLTAQVDRVMRTYNPFPPDIFLQYDIDLQVWGRASMETRLTNPAFGLYVDGIQVGRVVAPSGAFRPYNSVKYTLQFITRDAHVVSELATHTNGLVTVSLETIVSAGWYSRLASFSVSKPLDFPAITTSGVVGKVTIGPLPMSILCGDSTTPHSVPSPYQLVLQPAGGSSILVSFDSFVTDFCFDYGTLHAELSPGLYSIRIDPCVGFCYPWETALSVNVEPNTIVTVELSFDTGIR